MPLLQTPALNRLAEQPPIIIVGMHRSGTSLVTRLLRLLGIHMGADPDPNAESKHLRSLNKHTFRVVGAEWNTPEIVLEAMESPAFVAQQAGYYRAHLLSGAGGLRYWGIRYWLALRAGGALPLWGWKDPRTSLTLPIWLQVCPQAYVVHIIRNGIDVAISLHRRHVARNNRWRVPPDHRDRRGFDFRFCFSLWETYQAHLLTYRDTVPAERYIEFQYEMLLREPEPILRVVLSRLNVPVEEPRLAAAVATINTGRLDNRAYAAAYQDFIPDLLENPLMRALGYSGQ
jgi:LPS sulfotransferase NodH